MRKAGKKGIADTMKVKERKRSDAKRQEANNEVGE